MCPQNLRFWQSIFWPWVVSAGLAHPGAKNCKICPRKRWFFRQSTFQDWAAGLLWLISIQIWPQRWPSQARDGQASDGQAKQEDIQDASKYQASYTVFICLGAGNPFTQEKKKRQENKGNKQEKVNREKQTQKKRRLEQTEEAGKRRTEKKRKKHNWREEE